jgi:hypothetical protein
MHRSHQYRICQQDEKGFHRPLCQEIEAMQLQMSLGTSNRETIELAAKVDIPVPAVASLSLFDYRLPHVQHGIQAHVLHPKVNLRDAVLMPSATSLVGLLPCRRRLLFDAKVKIAARNVKFANPLVDAGTVNGIRFVHALIPNISLLPAGIPLGPYETSGWDAGDHSQFFNETVQAVSGKGLEICSIICDNLRAQVKGLRGFLKSRSHESGMMIHVPCINHIANSIFKHVLDFDWFGIVGKLIPDLVNSLNSPVGRAILG